MNHEEGSSRVFESLGAFPHRVFIDLEEIGTDEAKTRSSTGAIGHPGAVAKLYEEHESLLVRE